MATRRWAVMVTLLWLAAARASAYNMVFTPPSAAVGEGAGSVTVTVNLSGCTSPSNTATWNVFAVAFGSPAAQPGGDFGSPAPASFTIGAGVTSRTIQVPIVNDGAAEPNEQMAIAVRPVGNAQLLCNEGARVPLQNEYRAVVTIQDNDGTASVSIGNVTVTEGDAGTRNAAFRIRLSNPGTANVTVRWATRNGSAVAPLDYQGGAGTEVLNAGRPTADVVVSVVGDTLPEGDETFFVDLVVVLGAATDDAVGRGTIRDDDGATDSAVAIAAVGELERRLAAGTRIELQVRATRRDGSPAAGAEVLWTVQGDAALEGGAASVADQAGIATKAVVFGGGTASAAITASSGEAAPVTFTLRRRSDLGELFDPVRDPGPASLEDVLGELCERPSNALAALCGYLGELGPDDARRAILELAPSEALAQSEVAIETARVHLRAVGERQRQLRHAARRGRSGGRAVPPAVSGAVPPAVSGAVPPAVSGVTLDLSLPRPRDRWASREASEWLPRWQAGRVGPGEAGWGGSLERTGGGSAFAGLSGGIADLLAAQVDRAAGGGGQDPSDNRDVGDVGGDEERGGFFASGRASRGDRDPTGREPGLDYDAVGGTLGLDYRVGASTFVGLAAGYGDSTADFADGGDLALEASALTGYLTFAGERFFLDLVAGYGQDAYRLRRGVSLPDGAGGTLSVSGRGEPDGDETMAELGFGWDLPAGASTWTLSARGSWVRVNVDRYVETLSAGGVGLEIFDQDAESLLAEAALEWTHAASFAWGVLQPQLSAAARHEFEDQARTLRGRFVGDPSGAEFVLPGDPADATHFAARAGLSAVFPRGWAVYAHGEQEFGRDSLSVTTLSAGLRIEW